MYVYIASSMCATNCQYCCHRESPVRTKAAWKAECNISQPRKEILRGKRCRSQLEKQRSMSEMSGPGQERRMQSLSSAHRGPSYPLGPSCSLCCLCLSSHCRICCLSSSFGLIWSMVRGLRLKGSVWSLWRHESKNSYLLYLLNIILMYTLLSLFFLHYSQNSKRIQFRYGSFHFIKYFSLCILRKFKAEQEITSPE